MDINSYFTLRMEVGSTTEWQYCGLVTAVHIKQTWTIAPLDDTKQITFGHNKNMRDPV